VNELIRKFERESGIELYGLGRDRAKWQDKLEKFTELIVNHCLSNMQNCDGDLDFAIWKTKKDFGIEE
jgi:hypothetical protein